MPTEQFIVGPFEAVYVGDYGASFKLTRIPTCRTDGVTITKSRPGEYVPLVDNSEQDDNLIIRISMTFYNDDYAYRFSNGIPLSQGTSAPVQDSLYDLFLVHPNYTAKESWYFPKVRTEKRYISEADKRKASTVPVVFIAENRNVNLGLDNRDTVQNLLTYMGSTLAPFIYQ